jgi:hypothetical protein
MVKASQARYVGALVLALGCNSVLGIEERDFVPDTGGSSNAGSADQSSTAGKNSGGRTSSDAGGPSVAGSMGEAGGAGAAGNPNVGGTVTGGASTSGGASAEGGSAEMGGMGGEPPVDPQLELDDAIKNLDGFHFENDCGYVDGHDLSTCSSGEICFADGNKQHLSRKLDIPIGGVVGHEYDLALRLRGVLEPRDYPAGCTRVTNPAGSDIAIVEGCDGYTNATTVTFNIFELKVPSPAHSYYFNGVPTHPPHTTAVVNLEWTIRVAGQTTLAFTFDDLNGGQNRSCGGDVPGVMSAAFGGQFFQIDVEQTTLVE